MELILAAALCAVPCLKRIYPESIQLPISIYLSILASPRSRSCRAGTLVIVMKP